jgi:hypothetical protein
MARGTPYRFSRFARGLNTADGPYGIQQGYEDDPSGLGAECRAALNVVSEKRGNISKRDGCARLVSLSSLGVSAYTSLSVIGQDSGSFAVLSSDTGATGALFAINSNLDAELLVSGLNETAPWTFKRLTGSSYGPAYGMNGIDTPRETDGTVAGTGTWTATAGSVPNGTLLDYHANRTIVAGVSAFPQRVYASAPAEPRNWDTAGNSWAVDFAPDDGSPITAVRDFGPYLLVFKERGIWAVYDSETGANRKFADGAGTISPRSVVATDNGCYFLDPEQGVMVTDGNTVQSVSDNITPTLDAIGYGDKANASAAYWNGHYYLAVTYAGAQHILDHDTETKSWWLHNPDIDQLALWDRGSGPALVGTNDGSLWEVFKPGELTDGDTPFAAYWSGPFHGFGMAHLQKRIRELHIEGNGEVDVYIATDYETGTGTQEGSTLEFTASTTTLFGGTGTFGGTGIYGDSVTLGEQTLFNLGVSRSFSVSFYSSGDPFEINSYTFLIGNRKD